MKPKLLSLTNIILVIITLIVFPGKITAQVKDKEPVRTTWMSPDNVKSKSYTEWKAEEKGKVKDFKADIIYKTGSNIQSCEIDMKIPAPVLPKSFEEASDNKLPDFFPSSPLSESIEVSKNKNSKSSIILTYPNGNETFYPGEVCKIKWSKFDVKNKFWFWYWYNNKWNYIGNTTNSSYNWTIPGISATNCKIFVGCYDNSNNWTGDMSDAGFTIKNINSEITIVNPQSGDNLAAGSTYQITWTSAHIKNDRFWIWYYKNGWQLITDNASGNSYNWSVPDNGLDGVWLEVGGYDENNNWVCDVKGYFPVTSSVDRAIIVENGLYNSIDDNLKMLVNDWEEENATVGVYNVSYSSPTSLRNFLKTLNGLEGVLLIGDLPVPWFQISSYYDNQWHYQEFPVDLFYMDLDGSWYDFMKKAPNGELISGSDGIYDVHTNGNGDVTPDIVFGRISPKGMGDKTDIINFYLAKLHNYKENTDDIRCQNRSLAYVDDDWDNWGKDISDDHISNVFSSRTVVNNKNTTSAGNYKTYLDNSYNLLHLWCHSWSGGHAFKINDGADNSYFYNWEIDDIDPDVNFYTLFACSNSRYVEDNYCAGAYAFTSSHGIASIGTTHSGGMLAFDYFYDRLGEGNSYGQAFNLVLNNVGSNGFSESERGWYYGLTYNGDPYAHLLSGNKGTVNSKQGLTDIEISQAEETGLIFVYPNPMLNELSIKYDVQSANIVTIAVYDITSRLVQTLTNGYILPGEHTVQWNANNTNGSKMPNGTYFIRMQTGNNTQTTKVMLMR